MTFYLAQQCGKLCRFICDRKETESLESCAVETTQVVTLITVSLPATRHERRPGPVSLCVIDRGVELDHVCAGNHFIQHGQRRWSFRVVHALAFLLLGQRLFDFYFTESLDQRLHAGRTQSLDQLVGWRFMSIR